MMYYLESPSHDPRFNLALEEYVFERLDRSHGYFMLWQNDKAVIVGKNQNTLAEINVPYVKEHQIHVVRRLSGGGAVYHDLGNINFTFIVDSGERAALSFETFCRPVVKALETFGVHAEINGRNDMTIQGKKFSGSAQYGRLGRTMHHGTILYDSNLEAVGRALAVSQDKLSAKGVKSVRSRVTNVKPYVSGDVSTAVFFDALLSFMIEAYGLTPYELSAGQLSQAAALQKARYDRWDWNYGASPAYQIHKERRVEGCGRLEIFMDLHKGRIGKAAFYGDFFGNRDTGELARMLVGCKAEESALRAALQGVSIGQYFHQMDLDTFLSVLLE